jgi:hypothetical protein
MSGINGPITHWEIGNSFKNLIGVSKYKGQVERPRRRWEDDIKSYLRETGLEDRV